MSDTRTTEELADEIRCGMALGVSEIYDPVYYATLDTLTARLRKAEAMAEWIAERQAYYPDDGKRPDALMAQYWLKAAEEAQR